MHMNLPDSPFSNHANAAANYPHTTHPPPLPYDLASYQMQIDIDQTSAVQADWANATWTRPNIAGQPIDSSPSYTGAASFYQTLARSHPIVPRNERVWGHAFSATEETQAHGKISEMQQQQWQLEHGHPTTICAGQEPLHSYQFYATETRSVGPPKPIVPYADPNDGQRLRHTYLSSSSIHPEAFGYCYDRHRATAMTGTIDYSEYQARQLDLQGNNIGNGSQGPRSTEDISAYHDRPIGLFPDNRYPRNGSSNETDVGIVPSDNHQAAHSPQIAASEDISDAVTGASPISLSTLR